MSLLLKKMMGDLFVVRDAMRRFGETIALYDVSLTIKEGEIFGIIGPSGCGKTTLLRLLVGFLVPSSGDVLYKGKRLSRVTSLLTSHVGFAAQRSSLYDRLTVRENLSHFGRLYGLSSREIFERTHQLLDLFGLRGTEQVQARALSSGMIKRLDMACALIHDPAVLILDEPTADLDPLLRKEILALIHQINGYGTTVIITSHILSEIDALCDRIALIVGGKVLKVGNPQKLEAEYFPQKVIKLQMVKEKYKELVSYLERKRIPFADYSLEGGATFCLHTNAPQEALSCILDFADEQKDIVRFVSVVQPNLEDLFTALVEKKT